MHLLYKVLFISIKIFTWVCQTLVETLQMALHVHIWKNLNFFEKRLWKEIQVACSTCMGVKFITFR